MRFTILHIKKIGSPKKERDQQQTDRGNFECIKGIQKRVTSEGKQNENDLQYFS